MTKLQNICDSFRKFNAMHQKIFALRCCIYEINLTHTIMGTKKGVSLPNTPFYGTFEKNNYSATLRSFCTYTAFIIFLRFVTEGFWNA